jgi:anti-sigma factor RsiW
MNCKKTISRLSAYQDGEMPIPESRELERHLENCAGCRAELAAYEDLLDTLCRLTPPVPAPGFSTRTMAGLPVRPGRKYRLLPSLAYTLAMLMIVIGGFLLEISANGQPPSALPPATTFSAVLAESRDLGLLAVQESTLELFSGANDEK